MKRRTLSDREWEASKRISATLRERRIRKGKTAKFIAGAMHISTSYLSDIEAGRRYISEALKTAYEKALAI